MQRHLVKYYRNEERTSELSASFVERLYKSANGTFSQPPERDRSVQLQIANYRSSHDQD